MKFKHCDHCGIVQYRVRHIVLPFKHWLLCEECWETTTLMFGNEHQDLEQG